MFKSHPISFRRILLSRILLLLVPVLLSGVYVTYRKARSSLLQSARQDVKENAIREGERLTDNINALEANLLTASTATIWQDRSPQAAEEFLHQLQQKLPTNVQCIQLTGTLSQNVLASTCGKHPLTITPTNFWSSQQEATFLRDQKLYVTVLTQPAPMPAPPPNQFLAEDLTQSPQLYLTFSVPIYDRQGKFSQILHIKTSLLKDKPSTLLKPPSTVIISQEGTILAHPIPAMVGMNIQQQPDGARLKSALKNALNGRQHFLHLFSFQAQAQGQELLTGYTAIPSPVTSTTPQQWIVLSSTPLDTALAGMSEIQRILLVFTLALLMAGIFAAMYIATVLARPLEQLRDYALNSQPHFRQLSQHSQDFQIKEFGQLAQALQSMVERLTRWAEELETAWREAIEANRLKSEFLATTSHELRTPLNAIIGCLRLVEDGFCDDRNEELDLLQKADQAAVRLLEIIDDLLAFAKIESGSLTVEMTALDLNQLLQDVAHLQMPALSAKGLSLVIPESNYQTTVRGDQEKLQQVFINILSNAIKFTDQGSITISIYPEVNHLEVNHPSPTLDKHLQEPVSSLNELENKPENIIVEFQDTGVGIPAIDQSKLFRPFVMADGSSTRKFGGTGLGLAISRNLVEMMGGTIQLFSEGEGCGTTVQIILPYLNASPLATFAPPKYS